MLIIKDGEGNRKWLDTATSFKMVDDAEEGTFEGYASTFGNVDQGGDVVVKGAFKKSLREAKKQKRLIPMLWQHDRREPIGKWLSFEEDDIGLKVRGQIDIDAGPLEKRAHSHLKSGSVGGMSIGYGWTPGHWVYDKETRTTQLKQIDLREISVVTMPMNISAVVTDVKETSIAIREKLEKGETLSARELESLFRDDLGFSNKVSKRAVAANFSKASLRDSSAEDSSFMKELASVLKS